MKPYKRLLFAAAILLFFSSKVGAQSFTASKPTGLTAESYGLGIDNFGLIDSKGAEIKNLKDIKYGDQISIAFYNITGYEIKNGKAHLRMTTSVINSTDNTIIIGSQTVFDEDVAPEELKDDYIYGYLTISKDFIKGKSYILRLHLWDVNNGLGADLIWKFKANFK